MASADKMTARLWDAATGKPLAEPMKHEAWVNFAQFSPDGQRVVTISGAETFVGSSGMEQGVAATGRGTAQLWDAATGKLLGEPMEPEGGVNSAEFSPDGQRVLIASANEKTARLWDAGTGKPLTEPITPGGTARFNSNLPDSVTEVQ